MGGIAEMNKKEFDNVILKNLEVKLGEDKFGYETEDRRIYPMYYTMEAFEEFIAEANLPDYKGGELEERTNSKGEITPPKMASVASSSRFCYLALGNGAEAIGGNDEVVFEKECKIKGIGGTAPQLDAYIADENIFVEAKCHEIFDGKATEMRAPYQKYISGKIEGIGFNVLANIEVKDNGYFNIPYAEFGFDNKFHRFDFKQFLCHLLGIACQRKPAKLVYLFFKPKSDKYEEDINKLFEEVAEEVRMAFDNKYIREFCEENNIKLKAVAEYSEVMESLSVDNIIILY